VFGVKIKVYYTMCTAKSTFWLG